MNTYPKNNQVSEGANAHPEQLSTDTNHAAETLPSPGGCHIYVACLASYNAGRLHGRWINAAQDAEGIREEIAAMLKESREPFAEEWAIHDYEGFGDYRLSEFADIDEVAAIAKQIDEHGEPYLAALTLSANRAEADALLDEYCGEFNSDEEFARQLLEDTDMIPRDLPAWIHIDWEATAREIMMDYTEHNGHYFRSC